MSECASPSVKPAVLVQRAETGSGLLGYVCEEGTYAT